MSSWWMERPAPPAHSAGSSSGSGGDGGMGAVLPFAAVRNAVRKAVRHAVREGGALLFYGREGSAGRERRRVGDVRHLLEARQGLVAQGARARAAEGDVDAVVSRLERLRAALPELAGRVGLSEALEEERRARELETISGSRIAALLERLAAPLPRRLLG